MKTTIVYPIRDTSTDNMTLRLKCEHLTPILAVVFVLLGNVVTHWRCGGWKNFAFTRHKVLLVTVKEWLKSVLNYRSYSQNKTGHPVFWITLYKYVVSIFSLINWECRCLLICDSSKRKIFLYLKLLQTNTFYSTCLSPASICRFRSIHAG